MDNEITDFTVYPLEGFWKKVNGEELDKNKRCSQRHLRI